MHPSLVVLDAGASGALRDRIAAELKGIGSSGDAATWAHRVLAAKDTLVTADAEQIEAAFRQKLGILPCPTRPTNTIKLMLVKPARRADTPLVDKSELSYPHSRSRARMFVTKRPCLVCGRTPPDPHHLRFAQHQALGRQ